MKKSILSVITRIFALTMVPAAVAVSVACSSDECLDNKNSLPLAGFYNSDSIPKQISIDSISIYGVGAPGDSILQDSVSGISQSYLPFRIDQNSTTYVIRYLGGLLGKYRIADTITFNYEIVPWFVSSACGTIYKYKMTSIDATKYVIDSVTCPKGVIDNANSENLKIFFRTSSN